MLHRNGPRRGCANIADGDTATPPTSTMNSRRLIDRPPGEEMPEHISSRIALPTKNAALRSRVPEWVIKRPERTIDQAAFSSLLSPQERMPCRSRLAGSSSHLDAKARSSRACWRKLRKQRPHESRGPRATFAGLGPYLVELLRVPEDAIKALDIYAP